MGARSCAEAGTSEMDEVYSEMIAFSIYKYNILQRRGAMGTVHSKKKNKQM